MQNQRTIKESLKVTLIFPILDNNGEPFDIEVWRWWQREIFRLGDYTELGNAKMRLPRAHRSQPDHRHDRRTFSTRCHPEFLKEARKRFAQDAMYLEYHPVQFELIRE